ncbi:MULTISPECIES: type III restriction-modification system endonuclease [Dethiosulfovibrio]|uniref:DEAD/DEAH box helicase family protein n=2 Tax=Dethiosulfovibrio TaxID=47054 RepID=A0ABS9EQ24_9BACT|nr:MULTISPECIES: DEAD/DEAH box helicase family protein [Dethiosulfovibrio]MCF4114298.1 DEAD/DEAH box helicase family protein [Dethiosulfovibrio russensis]MCF4143290.1 DEAD/DEAH box helicase family protein [Dethiosulfovibrio marinus]MCF4145459.1 DEAD/DEAH box helicase family protein [Dethiosulfovibrio acidaminovorans]
MTAHPLKLKFKKQEYQSMAVKAVVDCFKGQPRISSVSHRIDPGVENDLDRQKTEDKLLEHKGFGNAPIALSDGALLENIQEVQRRQNLPISTELVKDKISSINLDVEMETGTGKTYCYIKTFFEMNREYGWSKFIVVVPSIAIREGVKKSLEITSDHFLEEYGKRIKFFVYDSSRPHELLNYSSDAGINVMVINIQAFNARGKANRRIYECLDDFQSRKPIDVIKANRPILILDEPQKMEGKKTLESLGNFDPLMILRYSATHKTQHNKVYRLDALDAYNQKLVKKISVRGISVKGLAGTYGYLYLESIQISRKNPVARLEMEVKQGNGIKRQIRKVSVGDDLYVLSNGLSQYKGYTISEIDWGRDIVSFTNGLVLESGEAVGEVNEMELRRIQIREAIGAHLEKERRLFPLGIKVLSLFFVDEVAKYRVYENGHKKRGEYGKIFEDEYRACVDEAMSTLDIGSNKDYKEYLEGIGVEKTHDGYFSIDKKSKQLIDPSIKKVKNEFTGQKEELSFDTDAYDLILKDKERLLSIDEPVRFIFSHSALREGWDNPNVFVICALKHSDNTVSRRQEVGRGLRLCVDRNGERQDDPNTVHNTNVLTVVASESYRDFVSGLQKDIRETLSSRPKMADMAYFKGKFVSTESGPLTLSSEMARKIEFYLIKQGYVDESMHITQAYHDRKEQGKLAELPEDLKPMSEAIFVLIDGVFSEGAGPQISNDRGKKTNSLNENFKKKEFLELWNRINKKVVYGVEFDSTELIDKCIVALDQELRISPLEYDVVSGDQKDQLTYDDMVSSGSFKVARKERKRSSSAVYTTVRYDLIGDIARGTKLTRKTVVAILYGVEKAVFDQFRANPEAFISESVRLINEQKATAIVDHLVYDELDDSYDVDIFTKAQVGQDLSGAEGPLERHIYDYVVTDSDTERRFAKDLDVSSEVVVYAKLPKAFFIPTPVGDYNPDWAIAFKEGSVRHIYFVAETKGSMSSMDLKKIEQIKIDCARKFFREVGTIGTAEDVKYDVVDSYDSLMKLVNK